MATEQQIAANRLNAQHSTGPRTEAGKASSSQNALSHSLTAQGLIVLPHQQAQFAAFEAALRSDIQPTGALQEVIFGRILECSWNLERCRIATRKLYENTPDVDPLTDLASATHHERIQRYAKANESSLYKGMRELAKLQTEQLSRLAPCGPSEIDEQPADEPAPNPSVLCGLATVVRNLTQSSASKPNRRQDNLLKVSKERFHSQIEAISATANPEESAHRAAA